MLVVFFAVCDFGFLYIGWDWFGRLWLAWLCAFVLIVRVAGCDCGFGGLFY